MSRELSSETDKITTTEAVSTIDVNSTSKVDQTSESSSDFRNFSNNMLSKRGFWIVIAVLTIFLFGITGWIQFSCYPMITSGVLPKFCNSQEAKLRIIKDPRTHGNTLEIFASDPQSDEIVLRTLVSYLDSPKVANNPRVLQYRLALNPNTPTEVLDAFVKSEDVEVLKNIARRTNASSELLEKVASNPKSDNTDVQKALIKNPQISQDVLQKMASSGELEILIEIAKTTRTNGNVLSTVAANPVASDPIAQLAIAINKNASEETLKSLASSTNANVLFAIVNNPNASMSVMDSIGQNPLTWKTSKIQILLASKTNLQRNLMEKLAASDDGVVLLTLSDNSALPSDLKKLVVEKLAQNLVSISPELPKPPMVEDPYSPPKPDKSNCTDKHLRNNLIGGAVGAIGFLFGGPVGAVAAYGVVTSSLETATTASNCLL